MNSQMNSQIISQNESINIPSDSFENIKKSLSTGKLIDSYYENEFQQYNENKNGKTLIEYKDESLMNFSSFTQCYMNQSLSSKANSLNKRIIEISDLIKDYNNLKFKNYFPTYFSEEFLNYKNENNIENEKIHMRGRICSEQMNGKLSQSHIILEGCMEISKGKRIQLDFSKVDVKYSIFPGQIVIVNGKYDMFEKNIFYVSEIYYKTNKCTIGSNIDLNKENYSEIICIFLIQKMKRFS